MTTMLEDLYSPLTGIVPYVSQVDMPPGSPDVYVAVSRGSTRNIQDNGTGGHQSVGSGAGLTEARRSPEQQSANALNATAPQRLRLLTSGSLAPANYA